MTVTRFAVVQVTFVAVAAATYWHQPLRTNYAEAPVTKQTSRASGDPTLVYSDDPNDSWNQIFRSLFTRRFRVRVSDAFPERGPFMPSGKGMSHVAVSNRTFDRFETGDRAIEPLYPSFFNPDGVRRVLTEPHYSTLKSALNRALAETRSRSEIERALMQSDLWAAYDTVFAQKFLTPRQEYLRQRREVLLSLLGRFTLKLSLTPEEIQNLSGNYAAARTRNSLPDIFAVNGEWLEIRMSPHRMHDSAADFRRCARVFLKPEDPTVNKKELLERLRKGNFFAHVDSMVLIMQNLLVDNSRNVTPADLITDVQIRRFTKDRRGHVVRTELHQFELSRRALLRNPGAGGLIEISENEGLYLPTAGNDYFFASPQFTNQGTSYPVLVNLVQRCEGCHGDKATAIFTFSTHSTFPLRPINLLAPGENVHGWYVAGRKQEREDFKSLFAQR